MGNSPIEVYELNKRLSRLEKVVEGLLPKKTEGKEKVEKKVNESKKEV